MIKQMAWNTFKNTGDINTFLELAKVKDIEKDIEENTKINVENSIIEAKELNGNIEIEGNSNSGTQYGRLW